MWNEPAANTDGSAPAETPEQPEPAYESKQDEPSGLDPRAADPRTPEAPAPAADEVTSLPGYAAKLPSKHYSGFINTTAAGGRPRRTRPADTLNPRGGCLAKRVQRRRP